MLIFDIRKCIGITLKHEIFLCMISSVIFAKNHENRSATINQFKNKQEKYGNSQKYDAKKVKINYLQKYHACKNIMIYSWHEQ